MSDPWLQNEVIVPVSLTPLQKEVYKSVFGVNFLRTQPRLTLNTSSHREEYRDLEDANYHIR
jgi:hypothetical protein